MQEGIKNIFDWTTKNWKLVAAIGGGLVLLNFLGTAKTLLSLGKIMLGFVFSKPFLLATAFVAPAFLKVIPDEIKLAISELEKMGGATEENRRKLKEKLIAEREQKNVFQIGEKAALDKMIKFLDTGVIREGKARLDFKEYNEGVPIMDAIKEGKDFHRGGYNPSGVGRVHAGEFVLQKSAVDKIGLEKLYAMNSGNPISFTFEDLPPIDMRTKKTVSEKNNISATQVIRVSSTNNNNALMNEVPILFGFDNLVYT